MKKVILGSTGLKVSRICFGTSVIGHHEAGLSTQKGAGLLLEGFRHGICFWDTSDDYDTHRHVRSALRKVPRERVVISTKISFIYDPAAAVKNVKNSLNELGTKYIDILYLHGCDSLAQLKRYKKIIPALQSLKEKGLIRAIGLSTHESGVAGAVASEPAIEVILATINRPGVRVGGGSKSMNTALRSCRKAGKGIVAMKVFGCGKLTDDIGKRIAYVAGLKHVDVLNLGMTRPEQVKENVSLLDSL